MSSPTKQISGRRLPPLANQILNGRRISSPGKAKKASDVEEREALLSNAACSNTHERKYSVLSSQENKGEMFFLWLRKRMLEFFLLCFLFI